MWSTNPDASEWYLWWEAMCGRFVWTRLASSKWDDRSRNLQLQGDGGVWGTLLLYCVERVRENVIFDKWNDKIFDCLALLQEKNALSLQKWLKMPKKKRSRRKKTQSLSYLREMGLDLNQNHVIVGKTFPAQPRLVLITGCDKTSPRPLLLYNCALYIMCMIIYVVARCVRVARETSREEVFSSTLFKSAHTANGGVGVKFGFLHFLDALWAGFDLAPTPHSPWRAAQKSAGGEKGRPAEKTAVEDRGWIWITVGRSGVDAPLASVKSKDGECVYGVWGLTHHPRCNSPPGGPWVLHHPSIPLNDLSSLALSCIKELPADVTGEEAGGTDGRTSPRRWRFLLLVKPCLIHTCFGNKITIHDRSDQTAANTPRRRWYCVPEMDGTGHPARPTAILPEALIK